MNSFFLFRRDSLYFLFIVYSEIENRDDRFVAAAKLGGSKLELFYLVRAVTPGRFVVPASFAEDMYRPEMRGIGKSEADITVIDKRAGP